MAKKKQKPLPPRRKRMKRPGRLQAARHWLATFQGKNVIRSYAKWFGVDLMCAVKELQILGVFLDQKYVEKLTVTFHQRDQNRMKKKRTPCGDSPFGEYGQDWDDDFAYIIGRTSWGFPYGVTWDEWEEITEAGLSRDSIDGGNEDQDSQWTESLL